MSRSLHEISEDIKKQALALGFQKVGITPAEPLIPEGSRLKEWLKRAYQGEMTWMSKNVEKRIDPALVLPNAQSIISVAMNYYTPYQHSDEVSTGKISRYAWGDDYHTVLTSRLEDLLAYITRTIPRAEGKVYVDTGPAMDKVWAQRAGLGWQGKHTNVITEEYGSWVFLGEVITNLALEYDAPATDHCGTCTLCIEACPTDAIVEPYVIDSNKCISYLTIEHRGEIAAELGQTFDRWIYGCDICQDVCPWNEKFSKDSGIREFEPRSANINPSLAAIVDSSPEEFQQQFRKSPVKRTKHAGLKRNASIALAAANTTTFP